VPDLVAGAVDVDTAGHDALREVRDVEDDAETSDKVGEYHPADHPGVDVGVLNELTQLDPVQERGDGVEGEGQEEGEGDLGLGVGVGEVLEGDDGAEQEADHGKVDGLVVRKAGEVVDDDPDVGPVESDENADMVQLLPGGPRDVAGHRVEQRAGQHAGLVGHQLQESGVVVSLVSDVALGPHQVPHHQTEEEDEAEEVCPDVDSLVVQGEDALYTALVAQTDRPVAGVY